MSSIKMIIGFTGTKGSGKTEIANFLQKQGYAFFSLSNMVREEAERRGLSKYNQRDLQRIGNELRKTHGAGVLAERLKTILLQKAPVVVDGIRNPGEVGVLRTLPDFYLVGIDAEVEKRHERLRARKRSDDNLTIEEMAAIDQIDRGQGEDTSGQQVDLCMGLADYTQFTIGSIDEENARFKSQFLDLVTNTKYRRPTFDELFMTVAYANSKRATCLRRKVGAALALNNYPAGAGYNGAPKDLKHCAEVGCERERLKIPSGERQEICRAAHAESNAISHKTIVNIKGATMYSTTSPCTTCAISIINEGVERVVYDASYPDSFAMRLLKEAKIKVERYSGVRPSLYFKLF